MTYNIAVVGATGAVGREMLQTLSERNFPLNNIYALASKSSIGREVSFGDDKILINDSSKFTLLSSFIFSFFFGNSFFFHFLS